MGGKILFVCTGNTCRSPACMAIYNKYVTGDNIALSRGISVQGQPSASGHMIEVLKEYEDIDLSYHNAKAVSINDIKEANLIVALGKSHKDYIIACMPDCENKVITLKTNGDVADPFCGDKEAYIACYKEIKELVLSIIKSEG